MSFALIVQHLTVQKIPHKDIVSARHNPSPSGKVCINPLHRIVAGESGSSALFSLLFYHNLFGLSRGFWNFFHFLFSIFWYDKKCLSEKTPKNEALVRRNFSITLFYTKKRANFCDIRIFTNCSKFGIMFLLSGNDPAGSLNDCTPNATDSAKCQTHDISCAETHLMVCNFLFFRSCPAIFTVCLRFHGTFFRKPMEIYGKVCYNIV